jgi:hypothetical protein
VAALIVGLVIGVLIATVLAVLLEDSGERGEPYDDDVVARR